MGIHSGVQSGIQSGVQSGAQSEDEARAYTRECELPVIGCCCPVCGDLSLKRQRIKRLLLDLEREHPGVKRSMLKAIGNVAGRHLLDRRLNPVAELRADVVAQLDALPLAADSRSPRDGV